MGDFVVVDIGGTSIKYGLIDYSGNLKEHYNMDTEAYKGGPSIIEKVKEIVNNFKEKTEIKGICISTAGMVCPNEGKIVHAGPSIPNYTGVEIKKIMEEEFNIPCSVENDVNCAALGEFYCGAGKGSKSMACLTVGTGIGGALIFDGNILHGFSNSAGEIGYMMIDGEHIQNLASARVLVNKVAYRKGLDSKSINGKFVFKGYEEGDEICVEEVKNLADILALGISHIVYLVNPEIIVLGGGIMAREDILRPLIERNLKKYLIESVYNNTKLAFAELKNNAGMIGAFCDFKKRYIN
ncbi:ROK family protein [Clostridium sp.]|uniref:ROK family protein n=1 Tax=Clostridium sp. TaxID=1506 RepID=UPI002617B635|nr:ROK family protein [Clostridium sp.]